MKKILTFALVAGITCALSVPALANCGSCSKSKTDAEKKTDTKGSACKKATAEDGKAKKCSTEKKCGAGSKNKCEAKVTKDKE